jgi:hypothetical protein
LFDCTFDVLDSFSNGDFSAEVTSATGLDEQPIVPLPSIVVTEVNSFGRKRLATTIRTQARSR